MSTQENGQIVKDTFAAIGRDDIDTLALVRAYEMGASP
jgi:hypothetical protein